uniref:Uncharacterized protein n=1 Tax=viral metagenome TaxID=1070528 RepID=A0A6C0LDR6_9ZZZZ
MLNYNTISLEENMQYIYLSIFIMLFIVIILFYLKETNRKHYKLFEKYGETRGGTQIYSKQQLKLDPTPLFYPSKDATVTLRPCEIRFNKNGSSKYIFKDGWEEIATINNNTIEKSIDLKYDNKILTKEGANKSDFNNFSEESRCFKLKNEDNDLNAHKYSENALISYNDNKYTTLQTADGSKKEYIQMNFNPSLAEETDYHKYAIESVCSYTYDTILTPPLKNVALYRLFINDENIIQSIDKIEINAANNNIFESRPFSLTELLDTSSANYYYDTNSNAFKFKINKNDKILGITIYKFERNLLCDKEEIISYDNLITDDTKLNTVALINIDKLIEPIVINDTELTADILDKFRTRVGNNYEPKNFANKEKILEIIKNHIDTRIDSLNVPIRKEIVVKNAELKELEKVKNAFADKISTIDKYIINIITMDVLNYDAETKNFLNKYLKPGKISYQKYVEKKILEPKINDDKLKATLKDNTKTIDYAFGGNGQILATPHFPDAHRIDNANQTLSHGSWTIQSSLKTVANQGLSAILKDSTRRVKTQTIQGTRQVPIYRNVCTPVRTGGEVYFYKNGYYGWPRVQYGPGNYDVKSLDLSSFKNSSSVVDFGSIFVSYGMEATLYYNNGRRLDFDFSDDTLFRYQMRGGIKSFEIKHKKKCEDVHDGGYRTEGTDVNHNSAYGADGINPEITITMSAVNFISGFEFYGINGLYNTSCNAKNIEVYGKYQNAKGAWITTKVLTFVLPNYASWDYSQFYKLDIPGDYKQIVFKIVNNWGDRSSTKIGSITLYHHPITTNAKSMNLPTDIPVKINGINHNLIAGDYNMSADIRNKIYTLTHKQTGRQIAKFANANNLVISYGVPKDMHSLLKHNKDNISYANIKNDIRENDVADNLILLTANKDLDTYETYKIKSYVYNNINYRPNIKLYDSSKKEMSNTKYKVLMDDYPKNKNVIIVLNIYIIVDISITGAIYLKSTKNNNDLFEYNKKTVRDINTAINKSIADSKNAKNLDDLKDIFDITDKEDEIDDLELSLVKKSAVKKDAFGKTILSIRRDIEEYIDDITINKLKNTYFNMANIDDLGDDNNAKVYHNEINITEAIGAGAGDKYKKYISYQDVPSDLRTPSIEKVQSNEIYDVRDYAKKYIYFTVKSK